MEVRHLSRTAGGLPRGGRWIRATDAFNVNVLEYTDIPIIIWNIRNKIKDPPKYTQILYQGIKQCVTRVVEINGNLDSRYFLIHTPGIITRTHIRNIRLFLSGNFPGKIRILMILDYRNKKKTSKHI